MPRNSKADKSKEQLLAELARLLDEDADLRARAVDWLQAKAEEEEAQGKPGQILGYLTVQQAAADLGFTRTRSGRGCGKASSLATPSASGST